MTNRHPVTRLPTRSPPPDHLRREALRTSFLRGLATDVLSGEAESSATYMASLSPSDRRRASERREERAEAVHRLVRHILFWLDLIIAVFAMAMIVGVGALLARSVFLRWDATEVVLLVKIGCPAFVGAAVWGLRLWLRRRRR